MARAMAREVGIGVIHRFMPIEQEAAEVQRVKRPEEAVGGRRLHTIAPGRPLADAITHGDLPGITHVLIDGEFVVTDRSRQTPPPAKRAFFCACCDTGQFEARGT